MTQIKVEKLSVEINSRLVLKDLTFEFCTNERILILGESGCGKSTLLLSLMGLTQRFENAQVTGDVFIDNRSLRKMKPYEVSKILGMVFQNPESQFCSLYPEDEVAFGLENLCVAASLMDDIIHKSLEAVDFPKEKYKNPINELSGGEQQRLALASIFAQEAELFLLDEPTANLDPLGRRQVVTAAKASAAKGKGLLVVEHNLEPWLPFLNRLIILKNDGTMLCDGKPRELFEVYGEELRQRGIWRPQAVRLYEQLRKLGHKFTQVPLNCSELRAENISKTLLAEAFKSLNPNIKQDNSSAKIIIDIKALAAEYEKNKPIFRNVNLEIAAGDFFALVGSNGSGKSTLAKTLIRLIDPAYGTVNIHNKNIMQMKLRDIYTAVGYVFQNPEHQFIEDTVWSEIGYSVDQLDIDEISKKQYVSSMLEEFELEALKKSNPFSLSGGQKRRLSVATMLVGKQKILILDEPTFGQDEKNAYKLMDKLAELNKQGITIFMITHDLDLVEEYTNKTAVMDNGAIVFNGKTSDLWNSQAIIKQSGLELPFKIKVMAKDEGIYAKYE
ncbi:MAG: Sigma 54 interacting domain protein [Firmicutes bacterium]|nr:Sigma 54 interacting domain protein [Bacillota bacterium]